MAIVVDREGLEALRAARGAPAVPGDIHDLLRSHGEKIGLATVYRHLQAMTDAGEVDVVRTPDGQASYRGCGQATHDHHHHLICRQCGRTVELELDGIEELIARLASENGYTEVDHSIELRGLCPACAQG